MNLKRFTSLVLCSTLFICSVISKTHKIEVENKVSTLSEIVKYIFKSCYENYRTVVINRYSDSMENFSVMLYNDPSNRDYDPRLKTTKVDLFLVSIDKSVDELEEILQEFQLSLWWNVTVPYFVLGSSKNSCGDAQIVLKTFWKMSILDCYFVCIDSDQNPFIYTFNPYSNRATDQWKPVQEITDDSFYMAIYNRPYKKESVCEGFTFDRTKYLDRATVNVISPIRQIHTYHLIIKEALRGVLNVSISYDLDDCKEIYLTKRFLNIEKQGDITQCFRPITNLSHFKSYPINSYAAYALSNNLSNVTITRKIRINFDLSIILLLFISAVIIYSIIFYTSFPRSYLFALLQFIRLWIGVPLKININFLSIHRLFYSIFIFLIILQAIFKGQYIKWLIISESSTNIVSLEKLSNNTDKKVFISNDINTGNDLEYWFMGYKYVNNLKCIEEVLKDKSTVCVVDFMTLSHQLQLKNLTVENLRNLYLSKFPMTYPFVYAIRQNWPLKDRFNRWLMSLESYGITDKIMDNVPSQITYNSQTSRFIKFNFQSLTLDSLFFAFYFWIIGIALSAICFIFEACIISKTLIVEYGLNE